MRLCRCLELTMCSIFIYYLLFYGKWIRLKSYSTTQGQYLLEYLLENLVFTSFSEAPNTKVRTDSSWSLWRHRGRVITRKKFHRDWLPSHLGTTVWPCQRQNHTCIVQFRIFLCLAAWRTMVGWCEQCSGGGVSFIQWWLCSREIAGASHRAVCFIEKSTCVRQNRTSGQTSPRFTPARSIIAWCNGNPCIGLRHISLGNMSQEDLLRSKTTLNFFQYLSVTFKNKNLSLMDLRLG